MLGLGACNCNCPQSETTGTGSGTGTGTGTEEGTGTGTGRYIKTCDRCAGTDGVYEHFKVTISGVSNTGGFCNCAPFNATFILDWQGDSFFPGDLNPVGGSAFCYWAITTNYCYTGPPTSIGGRILLCTTNALVGAWNVSIGTNDGGTGITYRVPFASFNCNGETTFTQLNPGGGSCNWPLTITVEPVHPVP